MNNVRRWRAERQRCKRNKTAKYEYESPLGKGGKQKQMLERFSDKETEVDGVNASFGMEKVCKKENIQTNQGIMCKKVG